MKQSTIRFTGPWSFRAYIAWNFFCYALRMLWPWCEGVEMTITQTPPKRLKDMTEEDFNEAHG